MREMKCKSNSESSTNRRMSELSYNDDSKEEKEALTENDEPHNKSCPLEIHIIIPPPFVKEYYYKDLM